VGVFWVDVDVLEEVVPHERVVALWVLLRKAWGPNQSGTDDIMLTSRTLGTVHQRT
jgi:hypothetical protein